MIDRRALLKQSSALMAALGTATVFDPLHAFEVPEELDEGAKDAMNPRRSAGLVSLVTALGVVGAVGVAPAESAERAAPGVDLVTKKLDGPFGLQKAVDHRGFVVAENVSGQVTRVFKDGPPGSPAWPRTRATCPPSWAARTRTVRPLEVPTRRAACCGPTTRATARR